MVAELHFTGTTLPVAAEHYPNTPFNCQLVLPALMYSFCMLSYGWSITSQLQAFIWLQSITPGPPIVLWLRGVTPAPPSLLWLQSINSVHNPTVVAEHQPSATTLPATEKHYTTLSLAAEHHFNIITPGL
uniref:Uncharacterized protein n=1 Tax=Pyxicephalus adspersus TaxID=30357 RepID=A0AAV3AFJ0_PYXAD|nr:TPA: hypothetical protein GDO54_006130 [Pyxicephalus adspersus]